MADFDSPWKEALDLYFEPFVKLFFADAHADIDWSRAIESLDKELQQVTPDAEIGRRYVDKLVKVWLKNGEEQWVLIHVEVQAQEDPDFTLRMYVYNYRLFDRYNKQVVSFAVLGDDNPHWRPDSFSYRRWGVEAGLWFRVVKLLDIAEHREVWEENTNPFVSVVFAHLDTLETRQDPKERKGRMFRLIRRLYERQLHSEQVGQLLRIIDWMMQLPKPLAIEVREELKQFTEEKNMPYVTSFERLAKEEGRKEGLQEGLIRAIESSLRVKFGEPGIRLMPEIRQIEDEGKLEAIHDALISGESLEGVRRLWNA